MRSDTIKAIKEFQVTTFGNKKNIEKTEALLSVDEEVLFVQPTNCIIISSNTKKKEKVPGVALLTNKRFIFNSNILSDSLTEIVSVTDIDTVTYKGDIISSHLEIHTITKTYNLLISYKKEMRQKVQMVFEQAKSMASVNAVQYQPTVSSADEIMKFKQLLDQGVITQEEFDKKKQQLLNL